MRAFPTSSSDLAGMFKRIERTMWLVCHLKWVKCLQILQHHSKPPRKQQLPQFPLVLKVRGLAYFVLFWRKRRIKLQKLNLTGSRDFPVESNCTRIFKVDFITNLAEFLLLLKLLPCNFKCRKYVWLLMISIKGKIA